MVVCLPKSASSIQLQCSPFLTLLSDAAAAAATAAAAAYHANVPELLGDVSPKKAEEADSLAPRTPPQIASPTMKRPALSTPPTAPRASSSGYGLQVHSQAAAGVCKLAGQAVQGVTVSSLNFWHLQKERDGVRGKWVLEMDVEGEDSWKWVTEEKGEEDVEHEKDEVGVVEEEEEEEEEAGQKRSLSGIAGARRVNGVEIPRLNTFWLDDEEARSIMGVKVKKLGKGLSSL
eukprot:642039-Pelagomonas_calceolata.AAC.4